jgi:type II restriction/modification system DNA methylase subunit YeeA
MNTNNIKAYAPKARFEFMEAVAKRLSLFGITANQKGEIQVSEAEQQGSVVLIGGNSFDAKWVQPRRKLVARCRHLGYQQTVEQVAYTWFNRICAIRYMELHDYLGHGFRVLSHPDNPKGFEILDHAQDAAEKLELDRAALIELKLAGNQDEALYRELLLGQCHQLHKAMPFLFEALDDETELLLPDNLTRTDSILRGLVDSIPEEDWEQVEIIGWLYQFYISQKKDEVIGKVVASVDIPAATQLFTPNWIVKYMVQNSLGAQWLATYPQSPLKGQMEYYIEPAEQTDEVNAQLAAITPSTLDPEVLTLIDPACGSGHILVEAYDLFKAIYLERGYRQRDVSKLILEKNLFGLDIDERAAQLTGFALMMKGRADDRRFFSRGVKLNVMALVDSTEFEVEQLTHGVNLADYGLSASDLLALKNLFEHATTFGSLIQVPEGLAVKLPALKQLCEATSPDLWVSEALKRLGPQVAQAELLATQYDAVVANPPYMGNNYQTPILKKYLKAEYRGYEKDFFSAFICRAHLACRTAGRIGIVTPYVWMFISSYEQLRNKLIDETTLTSLVQLEYNAFEPAMIPVATFTLMRCHVSSFLGSYIKLSEFRGHQNQAPRFLEAIKKPDCGWLYRTRPDELRKVPGSLIAYWASEKVIQSFSGPSLGERFTTREGMATADNDRFLRVWSEVARDRTGFGCASEEEANSSGSTWFPYDKGGSFRRWYGNNHFVVEYKDDGLNIKNNKDPQTGRLRSHNYNGEFGFREGLTWSALTSGLFSIRYSPQGSLFDSKGAKGFSSQSYEMLALLNSRLAQRYLSFLSPTLDFKVGDVIQIPLVIGSLKPETLACSNRCVKVSKHDWDAYERSWDFQSLPLLSASSEPTPTLESSYTAWTRKNRDTIAEMKCLEEENNRLFIDAYGLGEELTPDVPIEQITLTVNPAYRYGGKLDEEELWTRFRQDTMGELLSYAIGCMMGRYSLDAPGLIYAHSGNEGFDPDKYTTFPADDDGIVPLTDTEWFEDDACLRLVEFMSVAWDKTNLQENLRFLADNLSPKRGETPRETIRRYLCDKFYKDHLQTYKKRPIYWLFTSGKLKAFQCLVYLHRYNEGTLSRMRTEYVTPLMGKYDAYAEQLEKQADHAGSTTEANRLKKELNALVKKQGELRSFDDKLKHYADRQISLDLDDGVKVNYGKFGDLLSDVKAITGKKLEVG